MSQYPEKEITEPVLSDHLAEELMWREDWIHLWSDEGPPLLTVFQAFETLKQPTLDPQQSCLQIAKAYLYVHSSLPVGEALESALIEDEMVKKARIMRLLTVEALKTPETRENYFGMYAGVLERYFDVLQEEETETAIKALRERDTILITKQRGEFLSPMSKLQQETSDRIRQGKAITCSMKGAFHGDILFMALVIDTLATTLEKNDSQNIIYFEVKPTMTTLLSFMLSEHKNIRVIPEDKGNDPLQQHGILLAWSNEEERSLANDNIHVQLNPYNGIPTQDDSSNRGDSLRRTLQRNLIFDLCMKIADTTQQDDILNLTLGLGSCLYRYVTSNEGRSISQQIYSLYEQFPEDLFCFITDGSSAEKHLTSSFAVLCAEQLKELWGKNMGIVIVRTDTLAPEPNSESASLASFLSNQYGIKTVEFYPTSNILDSVALLASSQGVIGPDTFLTHIGEFFDDRPVLDIHGNSNKSLWRIDDMQITAQHPLAKREEELLGLGLPGIFSVYTSELIHPLEMLTDVDRVHYHPLIQLAQDHMRNAATIGLKQFEERVLYRLPFN